MAGLISPEGNAVHHRHLQIEQDEIRVQDSRLLQPLESITSPGHVIALAGEKEKEHVPAIFVIFDYENRRAHSPCIGQ